MIHFELFELYDLQDSDPKPSYSQLATKFGLAIGGVRRVLNAALRRQRPCLPITLPFHDGFRPSVVEAPLPGEGRGVMLLCARKGNAVLLAVA